MTTRLQNVTRVALWALLAFFVLLAPLPLGAQNNDDPGQSPTILLEEWDSEAAEVAERIERGNLRDDDVESLRATLEAQRDEIPDLAADADVRLAPLRDQLNALGDAPEDPREEAMPVADERERLSALIREMEALQLRANQADARARALLAQLSDIRRDMFARELLSRGPSVLDPQVWPRAMNAIGRTLTRLQIEVLFRWERQSIDAPMLAQVFAPFIVIGVSLFLLIGVRRSLIQSLLSGVQPSTPHSRRVAIATGVTLTRLLIPALSVGLILFAARNSGLLGDAGTELMRGLTSAAFLMIAAYALGGAFFSPKVPELRLSSLEDSEARHAHRWLIVLAGVAGLDAALVERGTHIGMAVEGLALLNAIMLVAGGFAVLRLLSTMSPIIPPVFPSEEDEDDPKPDELDGFWGPNTVRVVRLALTVAALTAPVLALIGFFAASRYLFYPLMFSGGVIGFCILLFHVVRAVVEDAASPAQGDSRPRKGNLRLIPVAVGFILFCIAVPVLSLIWGADVVDLVTAWRRVEQGFTIGEIVLSPIDFLSFAVVFSLGYVITRIAQGALSRSVLPYTGIDAGGRAAIIAGVGYLGVPLAALIAISATGLDLSNIAIVAGALSVGIGFGLQNIVNNFVSGIILLIERPIKAGDWVQVPSGHGYVKEVNVRSTRIESFDKCDFFVPNSELISSTVVNWTHNDLMGRMIVQTRCAYGNDPRVVEKILLDIARSHPMVLRRPAPYVLFFDFGDHGLEFQIRAFLRDVNWILNVQSDIRYEIHRRFVEAGISIPVPQQDLRLRNPEELGDALAAAMTPSLPPPPSDDLATGGAEPVAFRRRAGAPPPVSLPGGEPDPDR